jgi:hypothetical protein
MQNGKCKARHVRKTRCAPDQHVCNWYCMNNRGEELKLASSICCLRHCLLGGCWGYFGREAPPDRRAPSSTNSEVLVADYSAVSGSMQEDSSSLQVSTIHRAQRACSAHSKRKRLFFHYNALKDDSTWSCPFGLYTRADKTECVFCLREIWAKMGKRRTMRIVEKIA